MHDMGSKHVGNDDIVMNGHEVQQVQDFAQN
jgi:hypothetical protein